MMSGSFDMLVGRGDSKTPGEFTMEHIATMDDAKQALSQCYDIIYVLAGGDTDQVRATCERLEIRQPVTDMISFRGAASI